MNDLENLSDEEVLQLAQDWRLASLRGDKAARGPAHAYEVEHRRRTGGAHAPSTLQLPPPLAVLPSNTRWRLWR